MIAPKFPLSGHHMEMFDMMIAKHDLGKMTVAELDKCLDDTLYMIASSIMANCIEIAQARAIFARAIEKELQARY
jgi:hypothetical protein